eukprot:PhF_6_TR13336/c0_g1_i1/m.21130
MSEMAKTPSPTEEKIQKRHQPRKDHHRARSSKKDQKWDPIVVSIMMDVTTGVRYYGYGWFFQVYNADHTHHFMIPSQNVEVTDGAEKYIYLFNKYGPHVRYEFQLCWEHMCGGGGNGCSFGRRCRFIHSNQPQDMYHTPDILMTEIHYNLSLGEMVTIGGVPKFHQFTPESGMTPSLLVYRPNSRSAWDDVPVGNILVTEGSLYAFGIRESSSPWKPQHCAHFLFNKKCTRGRMCNFVHAILEGVATQKADERETGEEETDEEIS